MVQNWWVKTDFQETPPFPPALLSKDLGWDVGEVGDKLLQVSLCDRDSVSG